MLDPKNVVQITGGIVADPETVGKDGNIIKLRVAVDYAGSEKDGSTSGYFDVTYYANNSDNERNAKFVRDQVSNGKMKKGSQISLLGRLVQERWTTDDKRGARVVVVAEAITYAGSANTNSETKAEGSPSQSELPDSF